MTAETPTGATLRRVPVTDPGARAEAAPVLASATLVSPTGRLLMLFGVVCYLLLHVVTNRGLRLGLVDLPFLVILPALVWAATWLTARAVLRHTGEWWILHDPARGTAVATTDPPDETGRVKVASAGARPRGRGLGTELFTAITAHHADRGEPVWGYAYHRTARRLYRDRLGMHITPIPWAAGYYYTVSTVPSDVED